MTQPIHETECQSLSDAGKTRILALLERAEPRYASSNHKALARVLGGDAAPDDPLYEAVVRHLAEDRGVRVLRHGGFRQLMKLPDIEILFSALVATLAVDGLRGTSTYIVEMTGAVLRDRVNRILEEEASGYRLTPDSVSPVDGEPPHMSHKLKELRAEDQLEVDFGVLTLASPGIALLFFDIDGFKDLNTRLTETVVDDVVLRPMQDMLLREVVGRGFVYSVGGDEFIILLQNVCQAEGMAFAERLCRSARGWRFLPPSGAAVQLTLSVGLAIFPDHGTSLLSLRRSANAAEGEAKKMGRDRVCVASKTSST